MKRIIMAIAVASVPATVHAGFYTGNEVFPACKQARSFVMGYVAGAFDAAETGQTALVSTYWEGLSSQPAGSAAPKFDKSYEDGIAVLGSYCTPKGAILDQAADIFCQYLTARPGERHERSNVLLARALNEAWACPRTKNKP